MLRLPLVKTLERATSWLPGHASNHGVIPACDSVDGFHIDAKDLRQRTVTVLRSIRRLLISA